MKLLRVLTLAGLGLSLLGMVLDQGKGAPSGEAEAALNNVVRGLNGEPLAPDGRGKADPLKLLGVLSTD